MSKLYGGAVSAGVNLAGHLEIDFRLNRNVLGILAQLHYRVNVNFASTPRFPDNMIE